MKVTIGKRLRCLRCGKDWHARQTEIRMCPACKTKYWQTPKRDRIGLRRTIIEKAS